jgi:hypothetical protein
MTAWGRSDLGGDPIVVALTEQVPDAHPAALRADGVSYIFAGTTEPKATEPARTRTPALLRKVTMAPWASKTAPPNDGDGDKEAGDHGENAGDRNSLAGLPLGQREIAGDGAKTTDGHELGCDQHKDTKGHRKDRTPCRSFRLGKVVVG